MVDNGYYSAKDVLAKSLKVWQPPQFTSMHPIDYIETNLKVATEDDPPLIVPFKLNPVQRVYNYLKEQIETPKTSGKRIITLKSRRMGVTTFEQGMSYAKIKTQTGSRCVTVAQSDDAVTAIFEMVKLFHKEDPNYIKPSADNANTLAYSSLRSKFSVNTAKGTAIKRGDTLHRVHGSEVAFWSTNEKDSDNLIASLENASNKGEFVLESTANGPSGLFYTIWQDAMLHKDRWRPIFLGWYLDSRNSIPVSELEGEQILDTLEDEEVFLHKSFGCNINQLAWRREKRGTTLKGQKIFKQEFPAIAEEAFISTGFCYFDVDTIEKRLRQCKDPIYQNVDKGECIWARPEKGHKYIVAVDTSEGLSGSDPTPIGVLDWETGEQVYRINITEKPLNLGVRCVQIAKLYNKAMIAVENNNTGHSVLNTIMNQEMYTNIYYHEKDVRDDPLKEHTPGWRTDGKSKPLLLGDLEKAIENNTMTINDKLFLEQCRTFKDEDGKVKTTSRGAGHHGDIVIMWGIAWQVRKSKQAITRLILA